MNSTDLRTQKEIGSMLHWETEFPMPAWPLPQPAVAYATCRHAIVSLCAAQRQRPGLWLPSFFCPEVARACREVARIREYRDDCRWPGPDWSSLRPEPYDLVLAVNYFGVRSPEPWQHWHRQRAGIVVEDHTQDPFSAWALGSVAEYAVCSIRKTVPVPDGAILWSPMNQPLPPPCRGRDWQGSNLKSGAMLYKSLYLSSALGAEVKPLFRELQLTGEHELGQSACSAMSPLSQALLLRGVPKSWRERRIENARTLLETLKNWDGAAPVFTYWPDGHAPFTLPFVFESQEQRDSYQRSLQQEDVYCPVEWVCDTPDPAATDLSSRILSIPIDHRYGRADMDRIAAVILKIEAAQVDSVA